MLIIFSEVGFSILLSVMDLFRNGSSFVLYPVVMRGGGDDDINKKTKSLDFWTPTILINYVNKKEEEEEELEYKKN